MSNLGTTFTGVPEIYFWHTAHGGALINALINVGLAVSPPGKALIIGATQQLAVAGIHDDGTTETVTGSCTFGTSSGAIATVSAGGLVTAVALGAATITATLVTPQGTRTATTVITVTQAELTCAPPGKTLIIGATQQLAITAHYHDNTTAVVTGSCTFGTGDAAIATVSVGGLVTAVALGAATITATYLGRTVTHTVTVTQVELTCAPPGKTLVIGGTQQLAITGHYSDGTTATLTGSCTYGTSDAAIATVDAAGGLVTGVALGVATITATYLGRTTTHTVTVTRVILSASPPGKLLAIAGTQQLTITATYHDGTTADVTSSATYGTSSGAIATVSVGGLVTGVGAGAATITATYLGRTTTMVASVATPVDSTKPTIDIIAYPAVPTDPLIVDIEDVDPGVAYLGLFADFAGLDGESVIYRRGVFKYPYIRDSFIVPLANGVRITAYRTGGWPVGVAVIEVDAVDGNGNDEGEA